MKLGARLACHVLMDYYYIFRKLTHTYSLWLIVDRGDIYSESAFDRKTGDLWAGDVGQNLWEEININKEGGTTDGTYEKASMHSVPRTLACVKTS